MPAYKDSIQRLQELCAQCASLGQTVSRLAEDLEQTIEDMETVPDVPLPPVPPVPPVPPTPPVPPPSPGAGVPEILEGAVRWQGVELLFTLPAKIQDFGCTANLAHGHLHGNFAEGTHGSLWVRLNKAHYGMLSDCNGPFLYCDGVEHAIRVRYDLQRFMVWKDGVEIYNVWYDSSTTDLLPQSAEVRVQTGELSLVPQQIEVAVDYFAIPEPPVQYVWRGLIGNTSRQQHGPGCWSSFHPPVQLLSWGNWMVVLFGYNEGMQPFGMFHVEDPQTLIRFGNKSDGRVAVSAGIMGETLAVTYANGEQAWFSLGRRVETARSSQVIFMARPDVSRWGAIEAHIDVAACQVKFEGPTGGVIGEAGGYGNGPVVRPDKFDFHYEGKLRAVCAFQEDGRLWVLDPATCQLRRFKGVESLNGEALNREDACDCTVMWVPHSYSTCANQSDGSEVYNRFLRFKVNWEKVSRQLSVVSGGTSGATDNSPGQSSVVSGQSLVAATDNPQLTTDSAWQLTHYYGYGLPQEMIGFQDGIRSVLNVADGRKIGIVLDMGPNKNRRQVVEITEGGLVQTPVRDLHPNTFIEADGNILEVEEDGPGRVIFLRGPWDKPKWERVALGSAPRDADAPIGSHFKLAKGVESLNREALNREQNGPVSTVQRFNGSTDDLIITYNGNADHLGFHLGAVKVGTDGWLWKAAPSGLFDGRGMFDTTGEHGGFRHWVVGRHIFASENAEFWSKYFWNATLAERQSGAGKTPEGTRGQACQFFDYDLEGQWVGQFGMAMTDKHVVNASANPSNVFDLQAVVVNGRLFLIMNDEGSRGTHVFEVVGSF